MPTDAELLALARKAHRLACKATRELPKVDYATLEASYDAAESIHLIVAALQERVAASTPQR
jgi:hypothetical protein